VRRYTANIGWLLATRISWIVSAFSVGIYATRKLGPIRFGTLNYALALTGMFSIIATMSIDEIVVRQLVQKTANRDRVLGNFFMVRLVLFLIMTAALGLTLPWLHLSSEVRVLCIIIAVGYSGILAQGSGLYFQAQVESKYVAIPQLFSCLTNAIVRLSAAYFDWPLAVFALAESGNVFLYHFGCLGVYWKRIASPFRWTWDWVEVWTLFRTAFPLSICSVFSLVYARTDQLMIEHFLGPAAVGYYSLASRFIENWALAANMLCISFFPAIVTAAQISLGAYQKQLHRLYFMVFWCMAAAAVLTSLLSRPIILLLFGQAYLPTVPVLRVFSWTLLGTALLLVFSQWAINEKHLRMIASGFVAGAILNIIFNPLLIYLFGITGSAWSSLLSMPLGLTVTLFQQSLGREHLIFIIRSISRLPSFRLGEHDS